MIIAGLICGYHDAAACIFDEYRMVASVALERMTRIKNDGHRLPLEALDECLTIAGLERRDVEAVALERAGYDAKYFNKLSVPRRAEAALRSAIGKRKRRKVFSEQVRLNSVNGTDVFDAPAFLGDYGFKADIPLFFFNHHCAHALPTLFHTDWDEALLYTADGGGDNVQYSHRVFHDGRIEEWYGGEADSRRPARVDSIARAYGFATGALGYIMNRHEGKLTGLAAYGQPTLYEQFAERFWVDDNAQIRTDFESTDEMIEWINAVCRSASREDAAASIQKIFEERLLESVGALIARSGVRRLGLGGGAFANVRLNQRLAEELPVDEVFIYPAMGDHGLACGGVLQYLLNRDGLDAWLDKRYRLDHLYYGRPYDGAIDDLLGNDRDFQRLDGDPVAVSAELLERNRIVAIYTTGMEYGPRALGARSILAAAVDRGINDTLNTRLQRTEYMPFAPVVAAEDAAAVFELGGVNSYAARFMTITCDVKDGWRERIPAVVHVDGTARPQIIERAPNPLYYDILAAYKAQTGIPVLVNTSFNVHEEPIINTPAECARALRDGRIDHVATTQAVYAGPSARESG